MPCVFGDLPSLSSDCRDCRTVLLGSVQAQGNMKVLGSIITNCDGCLSELIQYQSLHQMYRQFHSQQSRCISFNPPIQFGHHQLHHTRSSVTAFVCPERFCLTKCQRFFRGRGTLWWNLLLTTMCVSAQQPFSRTFYSTVYNKFLFDLL